jgi:hypothetical protein
MSVQFTEPDLQPTYQALISGNAEYDWAIFNQSGNELKVQATGKGLEDLEEEFMDGRYVVSRACRCKEAMVTDNQDPIRLCEDQ